MSKIVIPIIILTLHVSLTATFFAALIGIPLGAALAFWRFPGRQVLVILLNTLMGLPPVVVGVVLYLLLSHGGALSSLGWLFTPRAMILAQTVLATPIVGSLSCETFRLLWSEYGSFLRSLNASFLQQFFTLLWDGRARLLTAILAGFGRAISEVGAVLIVGGNIFGHTRVLTTTIALETSKGELEIAFQLGLILLALALGVNLCLQVLRYHFVKDQV